MASKGPGLRAATDWRALLVLVGGTGAAIALADPLPAAVGVGIYASVVAWLLSAPQREKRHARLKLVREMNQLRREIKEAAMVMRKQWPWYNLFERQWRERGDRVVAISEDLYREWISKPELAEVHVGTVREAMQLAHSHLRLLVNYKMLTDLARRVDFKQVRLRIARNQGRLSVVRDMRTRQELTRSIELDEQVLRQAEKDAVDRERCLALLDAAESTLVMLLRRGGGAPDLTEVERRMQDLLMEAEAMDQAVAEVRRRTLVR